MTPQLGGTLETLQVDLAGRQLVSFDWPGFGDSDRPAISYDAALLRSALRAVLSYLRTTTGCGIWWQPHGSARRSTGSTPVGWCCA